MPYFYEDDLAHIHAHGFGHFAASAAPEIIRRLRSASTPIDRVLDLGCGAGPLTAELTRAGFQVTGIDPSAALLNIARHAVPDATFLHASLYDTPLPPCDAILAVGEPLTYHADPASAPARIQHFFRCAAATLPPHGLLVFDIIELGQPSLNARNWRSGEDWAVLVDTVEQPPVLTRNIETFRRTGELYRRGREVHRVFLFDTSALLHELAGAGFVTHTATAYGAFALPPRRRAFFCSRIPQSR